METRRNTEFGRKASDQKRGIQYELLKIIAEHNKERIFEYSVDSDNAVLYEVKDGEFTARLICDNYVANIDDYLFIFEEEDQEEFKQAFLKCLECPANSTIDIRSNLNGTMEWYRLFLVSVADREGKVYSIAGRFLSIHDEKLVNETIRRKAEIDALTGVYNHITFETLCTQRLEELEGEVMFLMMDVDDFKIINDSLGHNVGDMVLSQTGQVLNATMGTRGMAGRLGGDEFAALVWGFADRMAVTEFCETLRMNLKNIIFDMEYSASMGSAVRAGRDMTFKDLYYEADQAVYVAKKKGKNQIVYYDEVEHAQQEEDADVDIGEVPSEVIPEPGMGDRLLRPYERFVLNECLEYVFMIDPKGEKIYYANRTAREAMNGGEDAWKSLLVDDLMTGSPMDYKKEENQAEYYFLSAASQRAGNGLSRLFGDVDFLMHVTAYKLRGRNFKIVTLVNLSDSRHLNSVMIKRQETQRAVRKCLDSVMGDDFSRGYGGCLQQFCDYYEADCATIVYYNQGRYDEAEEFHRPNAEIMARIVMNAAKEGKLLKFEALMSEDGHLFLPKVAKIKEKYPLLYTKLVDNRVWSLAGTYLDCKGGRAGVLVLFNPRHNMGNDNVMDFLSSHLASDILRRDNHKK